MIKTCAIYARFSTDLQNDRSIEDQIRVCEEIAQKQGWTVTEYYTDHAVSAASLNRPGIQAVLHAIKEKKFDILLSEALDRLSRDTSDTTQIEKLCKFHDVGLFTLSEGFVTTMDAALKGLMNQLFLEELRNKVRRGQRGRVENGKVTAGLAYGYEVVRKFDSNGEPVRGERNIVPEKAEIVRRIFREYSEGKSPKAIAKQLNAEGVRSPSGKGWHPSTINGARDKGYGILNNEIYNGMIVWNKVREDKEPGTNRRVPRVNPKSERIRHEAEHLRIVDEATWNAVKARQDALSHNKSFRQSKRPKYLLSGLLKCGKCGGGYSIAAHNAYGCSSHRHKGTCDNRLRINRLDLEQLIIEGLKKYLMDEDLLGTFCSEFTSHLNNLRMNQNAQLERDKRELAQVEKSLKKCIEAIKDGIPASVVKDEMLALDSRKTELKELLDESDDLPPLLHPRMADHYKRQISELIASLENSNHSVAARTTIRELIDRIELTPSQTKEGLLVSLHGDLACILTIAESKDDKTMKNNWLANGSSNTMLQMVGPEGLEPPTRPL